MGLHVLGLMGLHVLGWKNFFILHEKKKTNGETRIQKIYKPTI